MNEILKKLLESEILTEENRNDLQAAILEQVEEAKQAAVAQAEKEKVAAIEEATAELKVQYAKEFAESKERLVEALDTKVQTLVEAQITELKEDIERFRDLEAEYAEKLVESKQELAEKAATELDELVEALSSFLQLKLTEEFEELRESIEEEKKNQLGRKMFEAFGGVYAEYASDETTLTKLKLTETTLSEAKKELAQLKKEKEQALRESKMREVLEPLTGSHREVMETILKAFPTDKLEETYDKFIGRVLVEGATNEKKQERESITESSVRVDAKDAKDDTEALKEGEKIVTGNKQPLEESEVISEDPDAVAKTKVIVEESDLQKRLRILSGANG